MAKRKSKKNNNFVPENKIDETLDERIEQMEANGGMSEAAMEAEIAAQENPKPDYLDENGNPHWFDEEEDYDVGQIPLEVVDRTEMLYANSDKVSAREYKIRIDEGLFKELSPEQYSETSFSDDEIPAITYRQSMDSEVPDQFLISKFKRGDYDIPLIQTTVEIKDEELLRQIKFNVENYEEERQQTETELSSYYERFEKEAATQSEEVQLQKALAYSLDKNVSPLIEVKLNRENWNKLFPNGTVETPVATVRLGDNQFEKLSKSDRNNLLAAMYQTLSEPAIVLEKETLDEKTGEFRPVNVYGKSFVREDSNHKRAVESVIIFRDGENISIGTHNKSIKDFVKQIKTADQIIYADSEISRIASLILQNGGSPVRLQDAINNRAINSQYDKNKLLSIGKLQFSNVDEKNNSTENLEQSSLDNAAELLKNVKFSPENYKKLLNVINEISEISGEKKIEVPKPEEIAKEENEKQKSNDQAQDRDSDEGGVIAKPQEPQRPMDGGGAAFEEEKPKPETAMFDPTAPIVYGKTVLPSFAVKTEKGLVSIENPIVTGFNKKNGTYEVESGGEKLELPKKTFKTLLSDKKEREAVQARIAEGKTIVFADESRGIKGTEIPEFSLITQHGLKTYKGFVPQSRDEAAGTYTLSNGEETLILKNKDFAEVTAAERWENKFDEHSPAWQKLVPSQYEDYFKLRDNTAANFTHNLSVACREKANSPCDAMRAAKMIIDQMSKDEKAKTQALLNEMAREEKNLNMVIAGIYHEAVKCVPLNEEKIKQDFPDKYIARPMFDTISGDGQKVENDQALVKNGQDRNLRIGSVLKNIDVQSDALFGKGKNSVLFSELRVVSASKEGNSITLMDEKNSYIKLPRDTVLSLYKEQQLREMKSERKVERKNTMSISYS